MEIILGVEGMTCSHCVARVSNALSKVSGVKNIKVELAGGRATVRGEGLAEQELRTAVEDAGYVVKTVQSA